MPSLPAKIQNALDESRMLMLGAQVLIGFHFTGVLEPRFHELRAHHRAAMLAGLLALLATLVLLVLVGAHHRIACAGEDRPEQLRLASGVLKVALFPLAAALGLDLFVASSATVGDGAGAVLGVAAALVAGALWCAWPAVARSRQGDAPMLIDESLDRKVRHVLTESRMTLPGAQALLGFATIAVLIDGFKELPDMLKDAHLGALLCIALSTCLLIAPAAYHRIAEHGESTERFHRVASGLVLAGMGALAAGLSLSVWIVFETSTHSREMGVWAGASVLVVQLGLWFGWTSWRRAALRRGGGGV
jgi:hypothetical protein